MIIRSEIVETVRYMDSTVIAFKLYIDDVVVTHTDGVEDNDQPNVVPKIYRIQIQDGINVQQAFLQYVAQLKQAFVFNEVPKIQDIVI